MLCFLFHGLRDVYGLWLLTTHLHSETGHFCTLLGVLAAFNLLTSALVSSSSPAASPRALLSWLLTVLVAVWLAGVSLRRPFALLTFSLFFTSLSTPPLPLQKLWELPIKPWQHVHLIGVVVGAISGAAFVPLDWGRPWQVFPIPVAIGAQIGSLLGMILAWFVRPRNC